MPTPLVFIDGDQGTIGSQIHERLRGRAEQQDLKLLTLPADARKDAQHRAEAINTCDIAILCLPGAAAHEAVTVTINPRVRVIDTGSTYRTTSGWVYGSPEMSDEQAQRVTGASRVTNPDCYPTGTIGLLRLPVQAGPAPVDCSISIHAVLGYSGDGRVTVEIYEGSEATNTLPFQVYGLGLAHKHMPEVQLYTGLTQWSMFVPAYGAYRQDIVLTVLPELRRLNAGVNATALHVCLVGHYAGTSHVGVMPLWAPPALPHPDPQALNDTDDMCLSVFTNDHGQVLFVAVLDNLGKDASGAAVQNLDLMLAQQWQVEWKASQHLIG